MILIVAGVAAGGVYAGIQLAVARPPAGLGARDGALAPCPGTPNCAASSPAGAGGLPSWRFKGSPGEARSVLISALREMRIEVVRSDEHYIHAVAVTRLMRFKDDLEFLIQPETHTIQFRSASRLGHSDLGVNRARLEKLLGRLAAYGIAPE